MFGKKKQAADTLPVTVHAVRSPVAFAAATKLWSVNARAVFADPQSRKEVLHFSVANPLTVMWLQRDTGRQDAYELIISWQQGKATLTDIHVILPGPEKAGDDSYPLQVLEGLLTTPATVPVKHNESN